MRAAVVVNGEVDNVILVEPNAPYDPPGDAVLVELDDESPVSPGWSYDGTDFAEPPHRRVTAEPGALPAGGGTSTVTVHSTFLDDAEVTFAANGVSATEALVDGTATCEVTVAETATVEVAVDGSPAGSIEITVEA